ncbi:NINE protein [Paenibacillus tarimensis]
MDTRDLTLNELLVFQSEVRSAEKSAAIAYLMLIGGHLGVHRFYLKRVGTAIAQLILFLASAGGYIMMLVASAAEIDALIIISVLLFAIPGLVLFIWIIVDLFLMSGMVREYNEKIQQDILAQIIQHRHNLQQD